MPQPLRSWCTISFAALRHNLKVLRRSVPRGIRVLAVVKDNAYGHGLVPVARALSRAGCEEFGVAFASEGVELRQAGIREPILLLGSSLRSEFSAALAHRLTLTISSLQEARELARAAEKARSTALVQAKLDTGMNRLGAKPTEFLQLLAYVHRHPCLDLVGSFTHLACAGSDPKFTRLQLEESFLLPMAGRRHYANTAASLGRQPHPMTHIRPGLGLYGIDPRDGGRAPFRPVLSWKSRILMVRKVRRGETVSYGATFRAPRDLHLATVGTGYADGLPFSLGNRGHALIRGRLCPIVGRVTMDMTMLDVSTLPSVKRGDEVIWIGSSGPKQRSAADLAREAGTIPWEIFTRIAPRIPRFYS
ncbi:MAG: alanine racemase [Verrucomicrobia bacterium]|nr:alanine racemase [Verrucomicrobiota bacterium]NDA25425.1 alanine racemase [Verrucomicrobiota bacterium]